MNFPSQIFLNNTSHGYRAVILKKSLCGSFPSRWLWLLNAIMKRCTKKCALQLYNTFSTSYYMIVNVRCKWVNLKNATWENIKSIWHFADYMLHLYFFVAGPTKDFLFQKHVHAMEHVALNEDEKILHSKLNENLSATTIICSCFKWAHPQYFSELAIRNSCPWKFFLNLLIIFRIFLHVHWYIYSLILFLKTIKKYIWICIFYELKTDSKKAVPKVVTFQDTICDCLPNKKK